MSSVSLESISKSYGGTPVVADVDIEISEGEFVVILGPSGCGKTTTLRMIAGFVTPTTGRIQIGGKDVTRVAPRYRNIGMVFQSYALFPNMTVAQNINFGLRQRKVAGAAINRRVSEMLELVHLTGRGDDYIDQLSGGQQQRVALARALAASPSLLLMDEPLGALDLKLREALQTELLRIQRELKITTILVTHDQQEAMVLADRIVIMAGGKIQQIGGPRALYQEPANAFVADFMGKNNLMQGDSIVFERRPGIQFTGGIKMPLGERGVATGGNERLDLCVRPEHIEVCRPHTSSRPSIPGVIEQTRFLGNVVHYLIATPWKQVLLAEAAAVEGAYSVGDQVEVCWDPLHAVFFPSRKGV
jgi:spermidine/putrescine ABC transporter ATP-binding subunit